MEILNPKENSEIMLNKNGKAAVADKPLTSEIEYPQLYLNNKNLAYSRRTQQKVDGNNVTSMKNIIILTVLEI